MVQGDAEMVVDNFAGGGGASTGIERALGRPVDVAINHDRDALEMHAANHPGTLHLAEDVFAVKPVDVTRGRRVGLAWFSPDCTHFSRAKGGKPVSKRIRGLAWVAVRWAREVRPRVIMLENVEEFQDWGPVGEDDRPDRRRRGLTFRRFVGNLRGLGYEVDWRVLVAADYGAPTSRKRLFLVARCDGGEIVWPEASHRDPRLGCDLFSGGARPWRTAGECIDWSVPCPSIFERKKPLAEKTLARIAEGMRRFVLECADPFVVGIDNQSSGSGAVWGVDEPLRTVTQENRFALVGVRVERQQGRQGQQGHGFAELRRCKHQGQQGHREEVRAFLVKYYGNERGGVSLREPMDTVTGRDRMGLVVVRGELFEVTDIGLRMLTPRELATAQGFPGDYVLTGTKSSQVARIGNSVCPPVAEALVRANVPELCVAEEAVA